jgi:hypothetical protein
MKEKAPGKQTHGLTEKQSVKDAKGQSTVCKLQDLLTSRNGIVLPTAPNPNTEKKIFSVANAEDAELDRTVLEYLLRPLSPEEAERIVTRRWGPKPRQISPQELAERGISYREHAIAREMGGARCMNAAQLAYVLGQPEFSEEVLETITEYHRKVGLKDDEIQKAKEVGRSIAETLSHRQPSSGSLFDGSLFRRRK